MAPAKKTAREGPAARPDETEDDPLRGGADPTVRVSRVCKVFESEQAGGRAKEPQQVLDGIDLALQEGEFVCLVGPSGCGKSTLLNLLAGFEEATTGEVVVAGERVTSPGRDRGVVFQDATAALFPWMTVEANVDFALKLGKVAKEQRRIAIKQYLELVGLGGDAEKYVGQLSGGMKQRLQIARSLAVDPRILLMDEPFGALDAITRGRMQAELLDIWQRTRKTIVFVTHDLTEAVLLADRVVMMAAPPRSIRKVVSLEDLPRPRDLSHPGASRIVHDLEQLLREIENERLAAAGS